jgi:hypothetical protein
VEKPHSHSREAEKGNLDSRDPIISGNGDLPNREFSLCFCKILRGKLIRDLCRYWQFLLYMFITLTALELILSPVPSLYAMYSTSIGYIGLSIEATLPLPQILANARSRSCKGFRLSVLVSWIAGDIMKMFWFFTATSEIPWAFKLCGIFQMCCDLFLGGQYWVYGDGGERIVKEYGMRMDFGRPNGMRTPVGEKDVRLG